MRRNNEDRKDTTKTLCTKWRGTIKIEKTPRKHEKHEKLRGTMKIEKKAL